MASGGLHHGGIRLSGPAPPCHSRKKKGGMGTCGLTLLRKEPRTMGTGYADPAATLLLYHSFCVFLRFGASRSRTGGGSLPPATHRRASLRLRPVSTQGGMSGSRPRGITSSLPRSLAPAPKCKRGLRQPSSPPACLPGADARRSFGLLSTYPTPPEHLRSF